MEYILFIGTNTDAEANMDKAVRRLRELFPDIRLSSAIYTEAMGMKCVRPFLNRMSRFTSDKGYDDVRALMKSIEAEAGRKPQEKEDEIIRLDLDILQAGDNRYKPQDWNRPFVPGLVRQMDMKFLGIIPARYASTRFPGKPLAQLGGKPVIQRVYEQVAGVLDDVCVATDDERIYSAVEAFGGRVVMTSASHRSGTDRCHEAARKIGGDFDVVVNIQGDEPFIRPSQIETVKACFADTNTRIATLVKPFTAGDGFAALENVNSPKVVVDKDMNALYFSRSIIPFQRNADRADWLKNHTYYKHIGLYAYRMETLSEITRLPQSALEIAESLEQLRWIENGYRIKVGISDVETIGIDTPQDLQRAEEFLKTTPMPI